VFYRLLLGFEGIFSKFIEPMVMVEIEGPGLIFESSVLVDNQILVETFKKTLGWVLS